MKKFLLFFILLSPSLFSSTVIGNPNVEINPDGLYLIQIKISSTKNITENDIFIKNFKSEEELSDLKFEFKIFENLQDYKRLTLAIPKNYSEDYVSFRLDIKKELKKDIFIFLPQNNFVSEEKAQVSFKLPAKRSVDEPQKYDLTNILSEDKDNENLKLTEPNVFSLAKPIDESNESFQDFESEPRIEIDNNKDNFQDFETILSDEVETIWSVSKSVSQKYDASIYQIMWGFYLENPNAFIDDNIHLVRADVDLTLPSQELVASTSDSNVKESVAFMETRKNQLERYSMKPILKLTAPEEIFTDSLIKNDSSISSASTLQNDPILKIDNSELNSSEIVYLLIRSSKKPSFTKAAIEEDLQDEADTFQTNLSICNDIETQELDLVRTYIEMDDWESAEKILNKLISNSKNNLIVSEAQSLLKQKK